MRAWEQTLSRFQYWVLLLALLTLSLQILRFRSSTISDVTTPLARLDFPMTPHPRARTYEGCSSITAAEDRQFEFNITAESTTTKRWQLNDSAVPESRKNLRGDITIDRGSLFQTSDIEVRVVVRSSEGSDLKNVLIHSSDFALDIDYNFQDRSDLCTEVNVLVLLRPWPRRLLDLFDVRTSVFDILFNPLLNWEVNNLIAHTSYGDFTLDTTEPWTDPLITHNVSVSSINGTIFGWFIPDEHLDIRNEHGEIGIFICPRVGINSPFEPKSISISSSSGNIHAETVFKVWPPQSYTHRTTIETVSGQVHAMVPHGSYTNFSSGSGNISCYIEPYGAARPDAVSEIYTTSQSGSFNVYLSSANENSLAGKYNPLLNTVSEHDVGEGKLRLRYPYDWYGEMEARIRHGVLEFDGSSLEDMERGEGYVKAKRGRKGESRMEASVGTGILDVLLGL